MDWIETRVGVKIHSSSAVPPSPRKTTFCSFVEIIAVGVRTWGRRFRERVAPVKWNFTVMVLRAE
jgi:hypothetical protein